MEWVARDGLEGRYSAEFSSSAAEDRQVAELGSPFGITPTVRLPTEADLRQYATPFEVTGYWRPLTGASGSLPRDIEGEMRPLRNYTHGSLRNVRYRRRRHARSFLVATLAAALVLMAAKKVWHVHGEDEKDKPMVPLIQAKAPKAKPKLTLTLHVDVETRKPEPPTTVDKNLPEATLRSPLDSNTLQFYEDQFNSSVKELEQAWDAASETVRKAFVRHHLPSVDGVVALPAPLALFQRHAEVLRNIPRPAETDTPNEKNAYGVRLCLVTSIFKAASSRLSSLSELESLCNTEGIGSPLFDREATALPSAAELNGQTDELVGFSDFVTMLAGRPVARSDDPSVAEKKIPRVLAQRLAHAVLADDLQLRMDALSLDVFEDFMKAIGLKGFPKTDPHDLFIHPVSPGNRPFNADTFKTVLSELEKWHEEQFLSPEMIGSWACDWTVEAVLSVLNAVQNRGPHRLIEKELIKDGADRGVKGTGTASRVPAHDLYSLAVALL